MIAFFVAASKQPFGLGASEGQHLAILHHENVMN